MKRFWHLGLLMGSLAFITISCEKDKLVHDTKIEGIGSEIQGKWLWLHSIGGPYDETLTPESEGYSKSLFIDDKTYTEYINDSLVYQGQYIFREDSLHENFGYLIFQDEQLSPIFFEIIEGYLRVIEPGLHAYNHYYTKE